MLRLASSQKDAPLGLFIMFASKVNTDEEPMVFKAQLMALTGVQVHQKLKCKNFNENLLISFNDLFNPTNVREEPYQMLSSTFGHLIWLFPYIDGIKQIIKGN